ncbi:hypothetical protein ACRYCC_29025 [Actinomadura scrupuli]|uniref:hypothetical protein n=1 Tax=Actinomadura scrupuli TaxID=559629 RepID=UPI003D98E8C0
MIGEAGRGRRRGAFALAGISVSVVLMTLVGSWRPPAAVPALDRPGLLPRLPWAPSTDLAVTLLLWAAMIIGTAGMAAGLAAVRGGWRVPAAGLLLGGGVAVAVLTIAPPMGSTDPMDYAAYGRMAALGHNPHVLTPGEFRATGDPVGALAPREWEDLPSVYGPLATAAQWAAAELGGGSAAWTVLWLKIWNAAAFLSVSVALARLAGPDPARRIRVHLLWTLNPLMLWALIGGAHVDGPAAALAVAGLCLLGRAAGRRASRPGAVLRSGAAGLLLGAAAAVKAPYALAGAGMVWAVRTSRWAVAALLAGAAAALATAYLLTGPEAIMAVVRRGRMPSWNTPWQLLVPVLGGPPPGWLLSWGPLAAAFAVALVLLRGLPSGSGRLRPSLAICLAWVLTTPVYYPWYEALVFPLIALAPASRLDWPHLGRALVATGGCLPGVAFRLGDSWLRAAVTDGPLSYVVPCALLALAVALVGGAAIRGRTAPAAGPAVPAGPPLLARSSLSRH